MLDMRFRLNYSKRIVVKDERITLTVLIPATSIFRDAVPEVLEKVSWYVLEGASVFLGTGLGSGDSLVIRLARSCSEIETSSGIFAQHRRSGTLLVVLGMKSDLCVVP